MGRMLRRIFLLMSLILFFAGIRGLFAQIIKDADGNLYSSVTIGKQVWMTENLKTTRFNDGTAIQLVIDEKAWINLETPAYCWLNNDISNKEVYGGLYNWHAVNTKKLCPKGWHVPTDSEWAILIAFLGDEETAGDKLKEKGTEHWKSSLNTATDEFAFTALPGGMRSNSGNYPLFANNYAVWWSATGYSPVDAWNRGLFFSSRRTFKGHESKRSGFSVRCIKD